MERIFSAKRDEVARDRARVSLEAMMATAARASAPRGFIAALRARTPALISEIKRASPSKGDIAPGLSPAAVAREYAAAGAAAVSVLTDKHFKGTLEDLRKTRAAVELPLLRKDFIFDPYQVYEARAAGADAVLLIAAMLDEDALRQLAALARELGMAALVEVHNADELALAMRIDADLIGINNRDLHTFVTDLAVTERLLRDCRSGALFVAESGIESAADIRRLYAAGARAFLVGESLLRSTAPGARLADLVAALGPEPARTVR